MARERGGLHAAPLAAKARHVHHDHVRVQLGLVVAVGGVHERRRHQALGTYPRAASRLGIVVAGLEVARLGDCHRLVHGAPERGADPPVALHPPGHRERLGHRESHVPAAAVLLRPVAVAPQHEAGARHLAAQDLLEGPLAHRPAQPQRLGAPAHPRARAPVLGHLAGVVVRAALRSGVGRRRIARVAQVIGERRARRAKWREGDFHGLRARRILVRPRALGAEYRTSPSQW